MGKPLLQHQIEMMKAAGITRIFVVIGHLGYEVVRTLGSGEDYGVEIEYIEQTEVLGIAHAVGRLESRVQDPFLLCLGDIFFVTARLQSLLDSYDKDSTKAVLASKVEESPEMIRRNFAIITGEDGVGVRRVIEKPRYLQNKLKGCGIYLFGLEIFDAIRRTPRTAMRDEYEITESIQIMIDDGHRVIHRDIIEEDLNLTVPDDLLNINLAELKRQGLSNLFLDDPMGKRKDLNVTSSVVGRNVTLDSSTSLQNCVVFDSVSIPSDAEFNNAILTPDRVIQCQVADEPAHR